MPDPADLLAAARLLLSAGALNPPSEVQLQRAVSTAHYAVFHKVVQAGAGRLMGSGSQNTAGYGLIYRSFNHGRMKSVCEALSVGRLSKTLQQQLGRTVVSPEMRGFAAAFATLQEARHLADYDPSIRSILTDAMDFDGRDGPCRSSRGRDGNFRRDRTRRAGGCPGIDAGEPAGLARRRCVAH